MELEKDVKVVFFAKTIQLKKAKYVGMAECRVQIRRPIF